ncbi:hypothetical protein ACQSSU_12805 [Micromonospora echinospora]
MGGEIRDIRVVVTTLDVEHWHPGWRAAAEASSAGSYHDWAIEQLRAAVRDAVARHLAEHPDLFATDADVV